MTPRRPGGVPCLLVADLSRAIDYYRDVLEFSRAELLGDPPVAALMSGAAGTVLLQEAEVSAQRYTNRRFEWRAWDAVFYVGDLERLASALRGRGALGQVGVGGTHISDYTFEASDPWGNILAFASRTAGPRSGIRSALRGAMPTKVRIGLRDRGLARIEQKHLDEFQAFYQQLPDKRDIFYMFFSAGLLHWVVNAERHVPREVNLVLIGSDLPNDEIEFLSANLDRPFHNIRLGVDDNTAWEFLFAANQHNFGYVDIDCFVLDPSIFAEMAQIEDDVAVNATWIYEAAPGVPIGCTHFAFINATVVRKLRSKGRYISPTNYDWEGSDLPVLHNRTYCRVPTGKQRRMLLEVLPADDRGRPQPPGKAPFFDTLVAYQVIASASGYRTHGVHPLVHRTQASLGQRINGEHIWQQDISDELIHVGGVSYYWKFFHMPDFRKLYLAAEQTLLRGCADRLPPHYTKRLQWLETELGYLGLTSRDAADLVVQHLTTGRGLSSETVDRVLGPTTEHQVQQ